MSDTDNNMPARRTRSDVGRAHQPMTDERRQRFIEALRQTGSMRAAARLATGETGSAADDKQQFGYAYTSFVRERRVNPDFDLACREALEEAWGRLEESLMERAYKPDVRRQYDAKTGRLIGESEGWEPANRLARAILARADQSWVESAKRTIESNVTVTHNGGNGGSAGVNLPFEDVQKFLTLEERGQLTNLLRVMMERKEQQQQNQPAALPSPEQSETNNDGTE